MAYTKAPHAPVERTCHICDMEFTVPWRLKAQKYCGAPCRAEARRRASMRYTARNRPLHIPTERACQHCGGTYAPTSSRQMWCRTCVPDMAARGRMQRYRISHHDWLAMVAKHDGACWLCCIKPAVVVDHDHRTNAVRGALCHKCNTALHHVESIGWLDKAHEYLKGGDANG